MEPRDLGIGIVLIIPSFVGGGALWEAFHNWFAVLAWLVIMLFVYGGILSQKYKKSPEN